jgi:hypothetical protein
MRELSGKYSGLLSPLNSQSGGGRGIRTPEGLHLSGFQDHRHRPLGHPSGDHNDTNDSGGSTGLATNRRATELAAEMDLNVLPLVVCNGPCRHRLTVGRQDDDLGELRFRNHASWVFEMAICLMQTGCRLFPYGLFRS